MKSKLYEDWSSGVDRRRDRSMSEPDRLWNLKNAYIDDGGRLRCRPGVYKLPGAGFTNCDGLMLLAGVLYTFAITGASPTPTASFATIVTLPAGPGGQTTIKRVWFAQPAGASYYVVIEFSDGVISHYYNGSRVVDANCPNTNRVTIAGGRVYCADNTGKVRYSIILQNGTGGLDWSTTGTAGAGFIAARDQSPNFGSVVTGLGVYQNDLVVFFENGAQVWYPDLDNTKIFLRQRLYNVGVNSLPGPLVSAPFGEDLAFLSQDGIRSLSVSATTSNRIEQDIGAPIRELPLGYQTGTAPPGPYIFYRQFPTGTSNAILMDPVEAVYCSGLSQMWFCWPNVSDQQSGISEAASYPTNYGDGRTAIVVMSYGTKRMSWSLYNIPIRARTFTNGAGSVNLMYCLVNTAASPPYNPQLWVLKLNQTDYDASYNEVPINVSIEWPFLDMDAPGGMKNFKGMDWVCWPASSQGRVKFLYDPNDETKETIEQTLDMGDSRGRGLAGVEVSSVSLAPVVSYSTASTDSERFRFSGLQLYYENDAGPL